MRGWSCGKGILYANLRTLRYVAKASFKKKRAYLLCPKCEKELCHIYRSTKAWSKSLVYELIHFSTRISSARSIRTSSEIGYLLSSVHHKLHLCEKGHSKARLQYIPRGHQSCLRTTYQSRFLVPY